MFYKFSTGKNKTVFRAALVRFDLGINFENKLAWGGRAWDQQLIILSSCQYIMEKLVYYRVLLVHMNWIRLDVIGSGSALEPRNNSWEGRTASRVGCSIYAVQHSTETIEFHPSFM